MQSVPPNPQHPPPRPAADSLRAAGNPDCPLPASILVSFCRQMAESVPWPVVMVDANRRVMHSNLAFLGLDHLDPIELIHRILPFPPATDARPDHGDPAVTIDPEAAEQNPIWNGLVWRVTQLRDHEERPFSLMVIGFPPGILRTGRQWRHRQSPDQNLVQQSGRRREILELLNGGLSVKEIASTLHLGEPTVRTHIYRLRKSLGSGDLLHLRFLNRPHREEPAPAPPPAPPAPIPAPDLTASPLATAIDGPQS